MTTLSDEELIAKWEAKGAKTNEFTRLLALARRGAESIKAERETVMRRSIEVARRQHIQDFGAPIGTPEEP